MTPRIGLIGVGTAGDCSGSSIGPDRRRELDYDGVLSAVEKARS